MYKKMKDFVDVVNQTIKMEFGEIGVEDPEPPRHHAKARYGLLTFLVLL